MHCCIAKLNSTNTIPLIKKLIAVPKYQKLVSKIKNVHIIYIFLSSSLVIRISHFKMNK
jgi:hypothetical protein